MHNGSITCVMREALNGREERKNIAMHSMEIKGRLCKHRGDRRSHEKIDKEISIPCDKIIMCCDKIRCTEEKVLSPLTKKYHCNTTPSLRIDFQVIKGCIFVMCDSIILVRFK